MSPSRVHLLIWPLKVHTQGFFDSLIFSPQNPWCNDFCENFLKILIPCLESRVMKLMTRNLVEIEANLWHGISDPELMTRHSTNDTELFRKMTSLILMGKISPPGHSLRWHSRCCFPQAQADRIMTRYPLAGTLGPKLVVCIFSSKVGNQ